MTKILTTVALFATLQAFGQCDYELFPSIQIDNVYQGIRGGSATYTETPFFQLVAVDGYHLDNRIPDDGSGIWQYNFLISKTGNSWQYVKKSCEPFVKFNWLPSGYRISCEVWYINPRSKVGAVEIATSVQVEVPTPIKPGPSVLRLEKNY